MQLTGDWAEDLVAIAASQIGYRESTIDFYIDEDGKTQGYTIYGDWYGADYSEWCAMFVSWSLNRAGVPSSAFPYEAGCQKMLNALSAMGVYENSWDGYVPKRGDVVFFNWDSYSDPDHVAIVEDVDEAKI